MQPLCEHWLRTSLPLTRGTNTPLFAIGNYAPNFVAICDSHCAVFGHRHAHGPPLASPFSPGEPGQWQACRCCCANLDGSDHWRRLQTLPLLVAVRITRPGTPYYLRGKPPATVAIRLGWSRLPKACPLHSIARLLAAARRLQIWRSGDRRILTVRVSRPFVCIPSRLSISVVVGRPSVFRSLLRDLVIWVPVVFGWLAS